MVAESVLLLGVTDITKLPMEDLQVSDCVEKRASLASQVNDKMRRSYDVNFKLRAICEAQQTNNVQAARKFGVSNANIQLWRKNEEKFRSARASRKASRGPKTGKFQDTDRLVCKYIHDKRNQGYPVSPKLLRQRHWRHQ